MYILNNNNDNYTLAMVVETYMGKEASPQLPPESRLAQPKPMILDEINGQLNLNLQNIVSVNATATYPF